MKTRTKGILGSVLCILPAFYFLLGVLLVGIFGKMEGGFSQRASFMWDYAFSEENGGVGMGIALIFGPIILAVLGVVLMNFKKTSLKIIGGFFLFLLLCYLVLMVFSSDGMGFVVVFGIVLILLEIAGIVLLVLKGRK